MGHGETGNFCEVSNFLFLSFWSGASSFFYHSFVASAVSAAPWYFLLRSRNDSLSGQLQPKTPVVFYRSKLILDAATSFPTGVVAILRWRETVTGFGTYSIWHRGSFRFLLSRWLCNDEINR